MASLLGIDLGTSSVRAMLVRDDGQRLALAGTDYDVDIPAPGRAEQNPDMWVEKACDVVRKAIAGAGVSDDDVAALSFSGQMHGLVCVGKDGAPLRPAIIWQDQRSKECIDAIYARFDRGRIGGLIQNSIAAGFLVASLCWVKQYEPETYRKIWKVMLPKDYLKFRLSGRITTDYSDASGAAAFDNAALRWSEELLALLDLDPALFPECLPATECVGAVAPDAAKRFGLSPETKVVNGGADQCMQAIGNGIVQDGVFSSNIGTGGQISAAVDRPLFDAALRTNTITHVMPDRWTIMGASLCSGAAMKWLAKRILRVDDFRALDAEAASVPPGSGGLIFLPYLVGERTPHLDPDARGMFCGLTLGHDRGNLVRAVMEGVAFALRDSLDIILGLGVRCERMIASGGGANSPLWLQIQADVFNRDVHRSLNSEQACLGAAITAGVGSGVFPGFAETCERLVEFDTRVYRPCERNVALYEKMHRIFQDMYGQNRETLKAITVIDQETGL